MKRTKIKTIKSAPAENNPFIGQEVALKGWVRTVRNQKTFSFVEVNDGSTLSNFQVVVDSGVEGYSELVARLTTGAAVIAVGTVVESKGKGQALEMQGQRIEIVGPCEAEGYPLQKKRHSLEFLRTIAHLRPRTNAFAAIARVRNAIAFAIHRFFQERGFLYIHTPIVTASDCEGAGELFRVTTVDPDNPPKSEDGKTDWSQDFFAKQAFLTVSGQLNVETFACALSDVYTFGPTFRAENSNTKRHLAEFWMVEPEMAFADLGDDMDCAEDFLKYVLKHVLENCIEDLEFFDKFISPGVIERLKTVAESSFERASYTLAVRILQKAGKSFQYPVEWGADLQTEHERFLAEEYFKKPVIIHDYPKEIKAFYMRSNDDGKTSAAMDVLVPKVGEIIGGSQREERLDLLEERIQELGLPKDNYWWYLELRKYGSVPHAGFGLGFERFVQFVTGMENIRDVSAFPRYPDHADF